MAGLQIYKCPCCDGAIEFDSESQKMKCPYCDTEFEMETLVAYDNELKNDKEDEMNWETDAGAQWQDEDIDNMCVYSCNTCGGEIISDKNTAATECPFCGNPIIMMGQFKGDLKPDYVIPFKLDKKAAKDALKKHYKGKVLLPDIFKTENHIDEIKGIYVPFWLFDADADAHLRYKATKIRSWSDAHYYYTETSHYSVVRDGSIGFQRVPVDGSSKISDDLMESIEPFDFSQAVDFQTAYLSGYFADRYDVDAQQSVDRANMRIKESTENAFASTVVGYSSVMPISSNIQLKNGNAKYALYPVWILNTSWNGEKYTFVMNGQTGKFVGNLPMDKKKYHKWLFGLFAGSSIGIFAVSYLIWIINHFLQML